MCIIIHNTLNNLVHTHVHSKTSKMLAFCIKWHIYVALIICVSIIATPSKLRIKIHTVCRDIETIYVIKCRFPHKSLKDFQSLLCLVSKEKALI